MGACEQLAYIGANKVEVRTQDCPLTTYVSSLKHSGAHMHHTQKITKDYKMFKISNVVSFLDILAFAEDRHVGIHVPEDQDSCLLLHLCPFAWAVSLIHVVCP